MRFTKENVEKVIYKHLKETEYSVIIDIVSDIYDMDDTPEKVVVPKCFDEWFKEIEVEYPNADSAKKFALWKLCQRGFGYGFERANGENIHFKSELGKWLLKNTFLAIDAVLKGYTIESEQL